MTSSLPSGLKEKETIEEERKRKSAVEILRYAGCLDDVDNDVAELCLKLVPKDGVLISLADFNYGVQKIKDTIVDEQRGKVEQLKRMKEEKCSICSQHNYCKCSQCPLLAFWEQKGGFEEVFGCEKPTDAKQGGTRKPSGDFHDATSLSVASSVGSQNHFDMAIDCMVCGKQIGFRGFCGKECHDKYYDELCSSADAKQEKK